jgi:arylsulfatase A-like enzyme
MEDDHYVNQEDLPADFYSSNFYGGKVKEYLQDWKERENEDRPFFAYLPFSAPHWPLQAPKEYVQRYDGVYDEGPEVLRQKRLANLIKLGMIDPNTEPHPVVDDRIEGWEDFSEHERAHSCKAMEAYAGMVEVRRHFLS